MKKLNLSFLNLNFSHIFLISILISFFLLNIHSLKLQNNNPKRSEETTKILAFEMAKNYLSSFTNGVNTQVALVSHDKPTNINNFMSKFIFVEHKPEKTADQEKEFVYFRICVPMDKQNQAYLDVFCPFSPCIGYKNFLDSKLGCLKELNKDIRDRIAESNKLK